MLRRMRDLKENSEMGALWCSLPPIRFWQCIRAYQDSMAHIWCDRYLQAFEAVLLASREAGKGREAYPNSSPLTHEAINA
jgi:hypothetical protein